jgi:hypothetical protein
MFLQIKNEYRDNNSRGAPPGNLDDYFEKDPSAIRLSEGAELEPTGVVNLPILATANDLREVVKFLKHKPNGVSAIEMTSAEPRRVFDTRKIAAYEFWGVIERREDRFQLTKLGEELAKNTEAECEIHRRILRSVAAYRRAVEWIHGQELKIATYRDVANFWQLSGEDLDLSPASEENIEAVIISFFSLCHGAELGTATVGKRGQPARLSVRLDQLRGFLEAPEKASEKAPKVYSQKSVFRFEKTAPERVATVYISAGRRERESANLRAALELADFGSIAFGTGDYEHGFLPLAQRAAMKQCQAAIFVLDETDCREQEGNGKITLRCDRVTEISVAQALFGERVVLLWNSPGKMPPVFRATGFNAVTGDIADWESNVRLVKCLKGLKG